MVIYVIYDWYIHLCYVDGRQFFFYFFFFQAEDGIRDLVRSRGLGDVYKRQGQQGGLGEEVIAASAGVEWADGAAEFAEAEDERPVSYTHLTLPTSDLV